MSEICGFGDNGLFGSHLRSMGKISSNFIEGSYTIVLVNKSLMPGIDSIAATTEDDSEVWRAVLKASLLSTISKFGWHILQPSIFLARPCMSDNRLHPQNILLGSTDSFTHTFSYSSRWYLSYRISWRSIILSISCWANCWIFIFQSNRVR